MPMLTDLDAACRKSGLRIVEVPGWRSRGHGPMTDVSTIACHHTATPRSASGDYPSLAIVRDGRAGLPGPLSQLGLGRDGTVYVIAAGVAYHAGLTHKSSQNNWHAIGIEAEHDGLSGWDEGQYNAYVALCAALVEHYGLRPADVQGHKEIAAPAGRKIDPTFDMDRFRQAVATHQEDPMAQYEDKLNAIHKEATAARKQSEKNGRLTYRRDMNILAAVEALAGEIDGTATKGQARQIINRLRMEFDSPEGGEDAPRA